jgi:hypothetical protein
VRIIRKKGGKIYKKIDSSQERADL